MATERLFVYGSLKRGGLHHDELAAARFLGPAKTAAGYALVSVGDYLGLVPEAGAGSVPGELFELEESLFAALDEFEGPEYERCRIVVFVGGAEQKVKALAYLKRAR